MVIGQHGVDSLLFSGQPNLMEEVCVAFVLKVVLRLNSDLFHFL